MVNELKKRLAVLEHGDHACFLFKNRAEQMEITIPFIQIGLERNERCIYLADPIAIEFVRDHLKLYDVNVDKEITRGALQLVSNRDFLDNGRFNSARMINMALNFVDEALEKGFTGLRGTGDVMWELGESMDFDVLLEYERNLDKVFSGRSITALCQCRERDFPAKYLRNSLYTHKTIVRNNEVYQHNPFYHPSRIFEESDARHRNTPPDYMYSDLRKDPPSYGV